MGWACTPFIVVHANDTLPQEKASESEISIQDREFRLRDRPGRSVAMAKARARLGSWMQSEPELQQFGLAALRLKAGLSQRELASKLETSQPNIARMEREPSNPTLSSIKAWATALGVEVIDVITAIEQTQAAPTERTG